ncbi:hypothetical protein PR048_029574 [Dryococelus australis]|uniref:Uncharacterized protein n=1 Tax=Dryococelus australis TaxID=614101 RepID=A0ABQ9GFW0_9NEOP|nr:hypothetical protein PR048_029574 [Dryococelus australis]
MWEDAVSLQPSLPLFYEPGWMYSFELQETSYFTSYVTEKAKHFKTNNVMITMGTDFTYMDAGRYYRNIDKLIK